MVNPYIVFFFIRDFLVGVTVEKQAA